MMIPLARKNPNELSKIEVSFWTGASRITDYRTILVVRYRGKYRPGSEGNPDATFMYAQGRYALAAFTPCAVLIDLTELEYEWGDMLEAVFSFAADQYYDKPFPTAVLVGEKCADAIGTLIHGMHSKEPATTEDGFFGDFEKAWTYLEKMAEEG